MAKIDNGTVSTKAWGKVNKSALGKKLADMYAAGDVTKAQIREVYANVPDDAFGEDSDGDPVFERSKAWGPHHELRGETIIINRAGVQAAAGALAGARSQPSLSSSAKASAKRHLRRHYNSHLDEDPPDSLKESRLIERGKPLEELVKGSYNYTLHAIEKAFSKQFSQEMEDDYWWVTEAFEGYVIVNAMSLPIDEFYRVTYSKEGEGYTFAPRDEWEIVQLAYEPSVKEESVSIPEKRRGTKDFLETTGGQVRLLDESDDNPEGPWRIRAVGITADVVNENGRRYPAPVLAAAVRHLKTHLHESPGQGRARQLVGEPEHPSIKTARRPFVTEVVINWEQVEFDGRQVLLEGNLLGTSLGKDIRAQVRGGYIPGISQRGYGKSHFTEENGHTVEVVDGVVITAYDLTADPSDLDAGVTFLESRQYQEVDKMSFEELMKALQEEGVLDGLTEAVQKRINEAHKQKDEERRMKMLQEALGAKDGEDLVEAARRLAEKQPARDGKLEAQLREELGLSETDDLDEALQARDKRLKELEEAEQQRKVDAYVEEQAESLAFRKPIKDRFIEAVKAGKPKTIEEAKAIFVDKRKEYEALLSEEALREMGFKIVGPVIETEAGHPAYARVAFELTESIRQVELTPRRDFRKPATLNEEFTALYLAKFDEQYGAQLKREQREFDEAEQTSDLNLPYSVSRAVVAEAFPRLVTSGIFDFGLTDQSPSRIYYEAFSGETGYTATVTDESIASDEGAWVALDYKRITPGTVVVTSDPAGTTYVEGTDYVIDYANGQLYTLAAGSIGDGTDLLVDYTYTAIRKGEMATIERGKVTLSYQTLEIAADRLATQISHEAIVFSRSQIGWDAVARTLNSLVRQVARKIDQGLIYKGLSAALIQASNSGGTWTAASDPVSEFVEKIGVSKVLVANRFYDPTFLLLSTTNSDKLANWDGFTAAGQRPDADINANGFVGRVKGLPTFESTEMSDAYWLVGNRELVMHRVYQAMMIKGPYPTIDASTGELIAADQYYAEEYNGNLAPVPQKGAYGVVS